MSLRRRGLLSALHLLTARTGLCDSGVNKYHHPAAAWVIAPRGIGRLLSRPTLDRSLSSPSTRRSPCRLHTSLSQSEACEPAVDRSQSPTHLDAVEDAVNSALAHFQQRAAPSRDGDEEATGEQQQNILDFPPEEREAIGVATHLKNRLRGLDTNGDCRRCWLQRYHCVCDRCVPLEDGTNNGIPKVNRLFLLTHHKEICLVVDTAKLILSSFPQTTRLVVAGVGREHQPAMGEMLDAASSAARGIDGAKCLILFPADDAIAFEEIEEQIQEENLVSDDDAGWDVIVIDGTWSQARKMHARYFGESTGNLYRVQLSDDAVRALDESVGDPIDNVGAGGNNVVKGHQLRRHPIKWREISTMEATRLLLKDMHTDGEFDEQSWAMAWYQEIGNEAARRQLGPPRES